MEPDSLRLHHDSVHYSTLRVHEETGDVVGIDLYLIRRDREWTATVALAEGGVTKPAPARTIALDSITGTLSLMWEHEGRVAEFRGRLSCQRLIGEFQWSPDAEHMLDTLPRDSIPGAPAR